MIRDALVRRIPDELRVEVNAQWQPKTGPMSAPVGSASSSVETLAIDARARQLTDRPYLTMYAIDTTGIYGQRVTAWHSEFEWGGIRFCAGVGRTEAEAVQDLNQMRYELIVKLLEAGLPIPDPANAEAHMLAMEVEERDAADHQTEE